MPSAMAGHSTPSDIFSRDHYVLDMSAYERHFPDFTQGSQRESDKNYTGRSNTRFIPVNFEPRSPRSNSPVLYTPTPAPRNSSEALKSKRPRPSWPPKPTVEALSEPELPWPAQRSSIALKAQPEAEDPRPSKKPTTIPGTNSNPLMAWRAENAPAAVNAKPETQQSITLPSLPNLTELVSGIYDNGTPVFSSYRNRHADRFGLSKQNTQDMSRPDVRNVNQVAPKYDEKKLLASIRYLEDKIAALLQQYEEAQHTIQYLREKAFEAESKGKTNRKGGRSDSALGSLDGISDEGEDLEAGQRKLIIEKNRLESSLRELQSRYNSLQHDASVYESNLETVTKARDAAVKQLAAAYLTNEESKAQTDALAEEVAQLKRQNHVLNEENLQLRNNVEELIANQEDSTVDFTANPDMTAKDLECDRIMEQRERAARSRQTIKKVLKPREEYDSVPVQNFPELIPEISEPVRDIPQPAGDAPESQPTPNGAASSGQPCKVTIDDVSLDLSYITDEKLAAASRKTCEDERSEYKSTHNRESQWDGSLGSPDNECSEILLRKTRPTGMIKASSMVSDEVQCNNDHKFLKEESIREAQAPVPTILGKSKRHHLEPSSSITGSRRRDADLESMTSAWIVPDITIDFPSQHHHPGSQASRGKGTTSRLSQRAEVDFPSSHSESESQASRDKETNSRLSQHTETDTSSPHQRSASETARAKGATSRLSRHVESNASSYHHRSVSQISRTKGTTSRLPRHTESESLLQDARPNPRMASSLARSQQHANSDVASEPSVIHHRSKATRKIPKPVPVSERMQQPNEYEDEPTIRPSQHPGIALATVLKNLEDELETSKRSLAKYQQLYDGHDPALSRRSRKSVFEKIQALMRVVDAKADNIYSLYDVLEGQKQSGQEMSQMEVDVTLQSIGIDPAELGFASQGEAKPARQFLPAPRRNLLGVEELAWEGIESTGTQKTSSSKESRRTL